MKRALRRGAALGALLLAAPLCAAPPASLEGDPFRGRTLLTEKECSQCHSVWGHGGMRGPDLAAAVAGKGWQDLVGAFWNHTPRMIEAMAGRGHHWPTLDRKQMADLLSYLYYLRLFDEPGDARRGAAAYAELGCSACHSLGGQGGSAGGPLDRFSAYPSAVILAQAMWNAGPAMQRAQVGRMNSIPEFSGGEMADIQAYIRARGERGNRRVELMRLPDPARGGAVFRVKGCVTCHPRGGGEGPDLGRAAVARSVAEVSGTLWNHSYAMNDRMHARSLHFPIFEGTQMADLISYLYFLGFFAEAGDASRGATVFRERGCARCHEEGAAEEVVNLSKSEAATDPVALSAAMWNHAPDMHELMADRSIAWPKFEAGDMADLAAYLRRMTGADAGGNH
jgi:mono/diheme cytochrome c family protein